MYDVYIGGYMDREGKTKKLFDYYERKFLEYGYKAYNPYSHYIDEGREYIVKFDTIALDEAKVGFFITDRVSLGTSMEWGYLLALGKPVFVYLYDDKGYKGMSLYEWLTKYSPLASLGIHVSYDENVIFEDVLAHLEGYYEYERDGDIYVCSICGGRMVRPYDREGEIDRAWY